MLARFSGASRAFGLPPPKAAGAKRILLGQKPRAKALPTSFLLRKKGSKENFHAKEKHKTNSKTR